MRHHFGPACEVVRRWLPVDARCSGFCFIGSSITCYSNSGKDMPADLTAGEMMQMRLRFRP